MTKKDYTDQEKINQAIKVGKYGSSIILAYPNEHGYEIWVESTKHSQSVIYHEFNNSFSFDFPEAFTPKKLEYIKKIVRRFYKLNTTK
jgi:hypothetical protein